MAIGAWLTAAGALAQTRGLEVSGAPSSLAREVQRILPDDPAPETLFAANRQADRAAALLSRLLESEGYYAARTTAFAEDGELLRRGVRIEAGALFSIGTSAIDFLGPPPDPELQTSLPRLLDLVATGSPARAAPILATEDRLLSRLRSSGYAEASADPVDALADGDLQTVDLTFRLRSGPKTRLGRLSISGLTRTRPDFINSIAPWTAGATYSPERLDELRARLSETGLFSSASVRLAPASTGSSLVEVVRDVDIELVEADSRTFTLGGSISTSEGAGANAGWEMRNVAGRGETLAVEAVLANLQRRVETRFTRPNFGHYGRRLTLSARLEDLETEAFRQSGASLSAEVEDQVTGRLRASLSLEAARSSIDDPRSRLLGSSRREVTSLSAMAAAEYVGVRDILDPSNGVRARVAIEPALVRDGSLTGFARITGEVSGYLDLGSPRLVGAVRIRMGALAGPDGAPPDRLFFAGGGGSVRGYEHQSLSPQAVGGVEGGKSLAEMSLEARWRVSERFGVVAFIDAGAAGRDQRPPFDEMRAGAGLGLRYYAGFGPLRADIAAPLDRRPGDSSVQVYVSIGQAF
jgi:translocation and assembly module TamA